ncbi:MULTISPECIES: BCCT family transporter [Pseudomonadaceae]|uniref:Choline/carnitine/betaine transporter n=2 Tax=Ectopseudomonas TaxID=3236654 RepID=A4Y129_ECTM1|nr:MULTISPECIES: BCCT family transporter [Pseudomonas]ARS51224.1 BCCT transporter [Pseudomonas mendocina]MBF8163046.1 BCCT family transporter [Pseudomonas mendocina]MDH0098330.1 BCCT family transporter [Pseudomonas sp. GD04158]USR39794.1 BCCT family transporter [Pseudomonas hydrolytica]UTH31649.1 BCCT family transporter [Pseudomonas hydrolytica]
MSQAPVPPGPSKANDDGIPAPSGAVSLIDTDYVVGQDNIRGRYLVNLDIHGKVFLVSALSALIFVVLALALHNEVEPLFKAVRDWLTQNLAWFFLGSANIFVLLCLGLIVSPLGRVRLGGTLARPDYSYTSWFAMLFAAGMGIGLMFYGVAEPMSHYDSSLAGVAVGENGVRSDWAPLGAAVGDSEEAARLSMATTIFHWGLHPWAIYAIVALALALFAFNKGLPLSFRSIFFPLLGERVWGWPGHVIDILAVFATLFGLVTSLGLGAEQATAGLHSLFGLPADPTTKVLLITVITLIALCSVLAGVDKGVKRLSEINLGLALVLLLFVLIAGPTALLLSGVLDNLGAYLQYLPALSNPIGREDANFSQGWTAFYWAWWISWSPFVGMFIARVSRGRTVREFLIAVLLVPSLVSVLWMSAFGGTALHQALGGLSELQQAALELKMFVMLEQLPISAISSFVAIVLVVLFFITSSDSGSLVIDTITAGGKVNAPMPQRAFWVLLEGALAVALLLGGGLVALQAMAVSTGLPFTLVLLVGCVSIIKGLMSEPR